MGRCVDRIIFQTQQLIVYSGPGGSRRIGSHEATPRAVGSSSEWIWEQSATGKHTAQVNGKGMKTVKGGLFAPLLRNVFLIPCSYFS